MIHWKNPENTLRPSWAVIFSLERREVRPGYDEMDALTLEAVKDIPGYLGYESVYNGNKGIFVSYWESREAIELWAQNELHKNAKSLAHQWYARYISVITEIHDWRAYNV